jgi:DegV family protein with EDD domain
MAKYTIVTDSTTYLSKEMFENRGIKKASLNVLDGLKSYKEDEIDMEWFENQLDEGKHFTTSQPSPHEFLELYNEAIENGSDMVFVIVLAKPLSGTYQSAKLAINMLDDSSKVHLFDSFSAQVGVEQLVVLLDSLIKQDLASDIIIKKMQNYIDRSRVMITLSTLKSVIRSGRLTSLQGFIGTVLRVKPLLEVKEGKLEPFSKARTHNKIAEIIIADMKERLPENVSKLYVRLINKNQTEVVENLKSLLENTFENISIDVNHHLGPVFTNHVGKYGYGIAYTYDRSDD